MYSDAYFVAAVSWSRLLSDSASCILTSLGICEYKEKYLASFTGYGRVRSRGRSDGSNPFTARMDEIVDRI